MKKKMIVVAIALLILAMAAIGATLAYFTDSKTVTNTVTMGNIAVDLTEPKFSEKFKENVITDVMPGTPVWKDPTVKNIGKNGIYVIVTAKISWIYKPDTSDLLTFKQLGIKAAPQWVATGLNSDEATFRYVGNNQDNALAIIDAGTSEYKVFAESTASDGTIYTMTIPSDWNYKYENRKFKIDITVKAIQSDNLTPTKASKQLANM